MVELAIFAKYWEPGQVKTRLGVSIGSAAAAEIHRRSLQVLLMRWQKLGDCRCIVFSPSDREMAFRQILPESCRLQPQAAGGLGERICAYFATAAERVDRAVIIGSDSPTLPLKQIEAAFTALESHAAVVGPTEDGGFYLLGLQLPQGIHTRLTHWLREIPWSTPDVWSMLRNRWQAEGVKFAVLAPWYDVDTIEDLPRLQAELAELVKLDELWRPLRDAVNAALPLTP